MVNATELTQVEQLLLELSRQIGASVGVGSDDSIVGAHWVRSELQQRVTALSELLADRKDAERFQALDRLIRKYAFESVGVQFASALVKMADDTKYGKPTTMALPESWDGLRRLVDSIIADEEARF